MKLIGEIKEIHVLTQPNWKDSFAQVTQQKVNLPDGQFYFGAQRSITHTCLHCANDITFDLNLEELSAQTLNIDVIKNRYALDTLGNLFELELRTSVDDSGKEEYRYYSLGGGLVAKVIHYYCQHCQAHYLMAFDTYFGDNDRQPVPDVTYIWRILQVQIEESAIETLLGYRMPVQ